ncbi:tRNA preQ1(34) S-adenosylmethionine ribosyltransferase-isomerase QueA [Treponema sp.]|uniref:tRNA preQ1(34) S-adenosylmethionine ribosyltransferase-isomerase QueA n=1 Tax=Treponema sp. TaxID=166 RepID=UPI002A7EA656|nr:tRNA preQ1(34) S-adenosylmethionine ribosyltransferase-isomerase QueA [Treponema sp.]MDY4133443.1 tRNA preQ1(34) S-adenosylmethionine ribosyltransferase-isomerase QueA [Treponema sp.]
MQTSDFYFELPEELIAQRPSGERGNDKLLFLNKTTGQVEHHKMEDLVDLVAPGTLMIFNDSRVRRSRCYGIKTTSGREQEFMFLNPIGDGSSWNTMVKGAKKVKVGNEYKFTDGSIGVIPEVSEGSEFRTIKFDKPLDEAWFERNGHIPLPPYIRREDDDTDSERYQTVYARETGSAAAPTAGLHFTESLLQKLKDKGIELAWVTLHVGLGTFLPVREDNIEDHKMHTEYYTVSEETAAKVAKAKAEGRPVLAVGTTSVRTLESASDENGRLIPGTRGTNIFMYPGYKFKVVDQMFTNFHTPESTLIMLVSAFAGKENIMSAYSQAVENKYRFFSYGDCMLIK